MNMVGMMTKTQVKERIMLLRQAGLTIVADYDAGTVQATDSEGLIVFTALAKGKGNPGLSGIATRHNAVGNNSIRLPRSIRAEPGRFDY